MSAARSFVKNTLTLEKAVVLIYAKVTFGASGAPTLDKANSKGIQAIARNSAGDFTVTFGSPSQVDTYVKLLGTRVTTVNSSAPAAPSHYVKANGVTSGTVEIVFNSAGTATDPASGEIALFEFILGNSTA